jgi:excisionase family DNA binding protein
MNKSPNSAAGANRGHHAKNGTGKTPHKETQQKIQAIVTSKHMAALKNRYHGSGQGPYPLLSIVQAAEILAISSWTLRQWLGQRRLAFVKVGRLTKIKIEDLEAFIERHRQEAITVE